jgi:hypothetical protein
MRMHPDGPLPLVVELVLPGLIIRRGWRPVPTLSGRHRLFGSADDSVRKSGAARRDCWDSWTFLGHRHAKRRHVWCATREHSQTEKSKVYVSRLLGSESTTRRSPPNEVTAENSSC